jgi:bacterioferritin (cytochrome b1)
MLLGFSLAEHASMLDLRAACAKTSSPARRVLYLRHSLDEARHARMYAQRSAELQRARGREPLYAPNADIEDLFENLGEVAFLAFVHRGERRGGEQFKEHRRQFLRRGDEKTASLFEAIIADEEQHAGYTWALLVELTGGEKQARGALRKAAAWEAYRLWRRAGRAVAGAVYAAFMFALYVTLFPFAILVRAARPARIGWVAAPAPRETESKGPPVAAPAGSPADEPR